jgi:hypothetical protein
LNGLYSAGLSSGYATLDSLRVALREGAQLGLSTKAKTALWGYSGGSIGSEWAAELQPGYAPELTISGVAIGGVIANLQNVITAINGSANAGLAFGGILGLSKAFPNLTTWLQENLVPEKKAEFYSVSQSCLIGTEELGKDKDIYSYFKNGRNSIMEPIPQSIIKWSGTMGIWGTPQVPLYVYKAVGDEVSPEKDTQALVNKYCAKGLTVEYQRDVVGSHMVEGIVGSPNALEWLSDRLAGKPVANRGKCKTENVTYWELSPKSIALFGKELYSLFQLVVGGSLGA